MCTSDSSLTCTNYLPSYDVFTVLGIIIGLFALFIGVCYLIKKCKGQLDEEEDPTVFNPSLLRGEDSRSNNKAKVSEEFKSVDLADYETPK